MRIKDLKAGDKVRCFGSTGAYLVEVENVVVDMTHYRDIAYVVNANNVKGTLTDNDEWLFYDYKVSNEKHETNDVQQKKRFEHLGDALDSKQEDIVNKSNDVQQCKRKDEDTALFKIKDLKVGYKVKVLGDNMIGEVSEIADNGKSAEIRVDDGVYRVVNDNYDFTIIEWNVVPEYAEDIVNKPSHYTYGKIEIIDIVEQVTAAYPTHIAFSIGNALKYICRAPFKNGVEDLKKAVWYLDRAIKKWDVNKEETK